MDVNDKNEEEIPSITVKTDEEYAEIVERLLWRPTFYKVAQFFIADLLRAEKAEDAAFFRCRNTDFKTVKVRGTVAGVGYMATKILITVDDGTGQIDCILQIKDNLKVLNETINKSLCDSQNQKDRGTVVLLSRCKRKLRTIPINDNDVKLGDTVVLVGNLAEFYENRTVYIKHIAIIENCDSSVEVQSLKMLFNSYENTFN